MTTFSTYFFSLFFPHFVVAQIFCSRGGTAKQKRIKLFIFSNIQTTLNDVTLHSAIMLNGQLHFMFYSSPQSIQSARISFQSSELGTPTPHPQCNCVQTRQHIESAFSNVPDPDPVDP
jgi:hypothetical protein